MMRGFFLAVLVVAVVHVFFGVGRRRMAMLVQLVKYIMAFHTDLNLLGKRLFYNQDEMTAIRLND